METGAVRYEENSHRQTITRVEIEPQGEHRRCAAIWVAFTNIRPHGDPYSFRLKRTRLREQREDGCGDAPTRFLRRIKTYQFAFDADSRSIHELGPVFPETNSRESISEAKATSNANLWDAISTEESITPKIQSTPQSTATPEFRRTAWVIAKKEITAQTVGLTQGVDGKQTVVALKRTRTVKAGQFGQIEASNGRKAIVRFYSGTGSDRVRGTWTGLKRWYDQIGGPYMEAKDDLYSPVQACIVEVSLDDIVEINDYFDAQKTEGT